MRATPIELVKFRNDSKSDELDVLAVEEPLEIKLGFGSAGNRKQQSLAVTMRTPGHDLELALGFLFTEGIITSMEDVTHIDHCKDGDGERSENVVRVEVTPARKLDWNRFQRHFYMSSSCGICGKASIENLENECAIIQSELRVSSSLIHSLGDKMRKAQNVFNHTGGLHATALFDEKGELILMREDIGRHNALDKVIGAMLFKKQIPLENRIIMLSGRSCFELIQKAAMARVPLVVSVGAPSSLAVATSQKLGLTLCGFTRNNSFNVYSNPERIQ